MIFAFGMPGATEWIIILVIVLIFFGVGKLPNVLSQMGKGVRAFKDGMKDGAEEDDRPLRRELDQAPAEDRVADAEEVKKTR